MRQESSIDTCVHIEVYGEDVVESREYKTAMALNNVGVALLEKRLYREALEVLKQSFHLIRCLQNLMDYNGRFDRLKLQARVESVLYKAQLLLASPQSHDAKSWSSKARKFDAECFFEIHRLNDHNIEAIHEAAHMYPTNESGYVIRIDTSCDYLTHNIVLQWGIIMMNLATACRAVGASVQDEERKQRHIRYGKQVLQVAFRLLTSNRASKGTVEADYPSEENDSEYYDDDTLMLERSDLITMLVVQGLMLTSFELDLREEGSTYYALLGDLHVGQHSYQSTKPSGDLEQVAAAA